MEQKVEISKSDHALDLLAKFNEFRKNNKHCDFIIRAGKKEMPVHKFVISASSEYFEAMLSHDTVETNLGVAEMKEVDADCVVKCIDFIYTGEAAVSDEKQRDLMHVAHMLRLERLYNGIATFLEKKLDCSSFYSTRQIANLYDCKNLVKTCNAFAMKNFRALTRLEDFKRLETDYVKFLLTCDGLKESDTIKCKALMMWINHESDRAASLFDLMKAVDFSKISMSYRRFLTENEPVISNSIECLKHVFKSVFDSNDTKPSDVSLDEKSGIVVFDSASSRLKRYDLAGETWEDMQVMHQNMVNQCSSVVVEGEYIYVFTEDRMTFRLLFKKPDSNWEQLATRSGDWGAAVVLNGMIYCTDHNNYSNRIERYNIQQNQWSFIPNRPSTAFGSSLAVYQESVFLMGGYQNNGQILNTVSKYDPARSTWSAGPTLKQSRYTASAAVLDETIYLFGGYSNNHGCTQSVEILYRNANAWQLVNLNNFKRQNLSSYSIDGKIYLVGSNDSNFSSIDEYDPNTRKLRTVAELTGKTVIYFSSVAITM